MLFVLTLFGCVSFVSCGDDDDPTLSVSNVAIVVEANGNTNSDIYVTAENTDWSVDVVSGRD